MSEYNIYDGAPCPVPACDGHLRVRTEGTIETEGGLTKSARKRISECDKPDCPYFRTEILEPGHNTFTSIEDGR